MGSPGGSVVTNLPAKAGDPRDAGLFPGSGRSPRVGKGNPLQYSCLENLMDRGIWQATVHRVAKVHDFTTKPISSSKQDCLMWVGAHITPEGKAEFELEIQNPDSPV